MENLELLRMEITVNSAISPQPVLEQFEKLQKMYPRSVKILFKAPPCIENKDGSYGWNIAYESVPNI